MLKLNDALDYIETFAVIYVTFSALTMIPSYLYRVVWKITWYGWSPIHLILFLSFFSPLLWSFLSKRGFGNRTYVLLTLLATMLLTLTAAIYDFAIRAYLVAITLSLSPPLFYWKLTSGDKETLGLLILIFMTVEIAFRSIFLSFDYRLTPLGIVIGVIIISALLSKFFASEELKEEIEEAVIDNKKDKTLMNYLLVISSTILFFIFINLLSKPNTALRMSITNIYLIHYLATSIVIIITIFIAILVYSRYNLDRSLIYIGNILTIISIPTIVGKMGAIALILLPVAVFFLSINILLMLSDISGKKIYTYLLLGYVLYFVLSLIYTFTFVYAYLPGIYAFGKKVPEFFSVLPIIFVGSFTYWLWSRSEQITLAKKKLDIKSLFVLTLLFVSITLTPLTYGHPAPIKYDLTPKTLRVMSYNIHQGFDLYDRLSTEDILEVIKNSNADVIGLQEVDTGRITSDYVDNLLYFASKLGYYALYEPAIGSTYGVAVISKYPIEKVKGIKLSSIGEQRVMLHVKVKLGGYDINFITVHLGLIKNERLIQVSEVINYINDINGAIVLVGDFNAWPNSTEIEIIKKYLEDAKEEAEEVFGPENTWPALNPSERIDYIFVNDYFEVKRFETLETIASDHLPVIADLEITSSLKLYGSMYVNDAGEPKGGFEWAAQYNVSGIIIGDKGFLEIIFVLGLSDPLEEHYLLIRDFGYNTTHMWMELGRYDGSLWVNVTLKYYETDPMWGDYHGYYIVYYLNPNLFPGFKSHYYVELRLKVEME